MTDETNQPREGDLHQPRSAAVLGAGSWGTALALLLHRNGHEVRLWSYEAEVADEIRRQGENLSYLPGVALPEAIRVSTDMARVVAEADLVVSVSPSQFVQDVMGQAALHLSGGSTVISASKGIEVSSLRRMDEVILPLLPEGARSRFSVLSGPSFATEVAAGEPTAVVVASRSEAAARMVQEAFSSPTFRAYTSRDVIGVEVGGAVKNVIALAAGVISGLGYGHNTRAALITRGLAEITRLGVAMGADPVTFSGLAGMGDLVLTCTGDLSRNRTVGTRLGRGESLDDILADMREVAEGVRTTAAVWALAERYSVEMPITAQVHAILEGRQAPAEAVRELMTRDPKAEVWPS